MEEQIKILEDSIVVIENWKWNMYEDDDEVGVAVESIKDVIKKLKEYQRALKLKPRNYGYSRFNYKI